jgi:hypothetical protein
MHMGTRRGAPTCFGCERSMAAGEGWIRTPGTLWQWMNSAVAQVSHGLPKAYRPWMFVFHQGRESFGTLRE